jgi:competence protein ComEA
MRFASALFVLALTARVIGAGQAAVPAPASPDLAKEKETFEMVCGICHGTDLVEGTLRTPAEFDDLIATMQSYGASATPEQFATAKSALLRGWGKANVNSAAAPDLAPVLDVTAETAAAVVAYREQNGRFASVDDLKKVPGVDPAKLDARRDRITF